MLVAASGGMAQAAARPEVLDETRSIQHALSRLTFGARPGDWAEVKRIGLKNWIDQQLHPESIEENPELAARLAPLESLRMTPQLAVQTYPLPRPQAAQGTEEQSTRQQRIGRLLMNASAPERRMILLEHAPVRIVVNDLLEGKIYRALLSRRQLEEVLVDFWFNHFNVHLNKGADRYYVTSFERDAIRPHVLGKFSDMLRAAARHPAMLFYLDNWQSVDPAAARRAARFRPQAANRGLNENYARELLELHTLGVDGGYTQKDVTEVARCFTGWSIRNPRQGGDYTFLARAHDNGAKTVLGVAIPPGGGESDGERVLKIASKHPSTARFLSEKLARRFVFDDPPQPLVDRMTAEFLKTDGDLRSVMQEMLSSPEFWNAASWRSKVKTPFEFIVSAARATEADVSSALVLAEAAGRLGQPLYRKPEPTGYGDTAEEWLNSAALIGRFNFASALVENRIPGVRVDRDKYEGMSVVLGAPGAQMR